MFRRSVGVAVCLFSLTTSAAGAETPIPRPLHDWIEWREFPSVPGGLDLSSAFVGESNGALIIAGGMTSTKSGEKFTDNVLVLAPGEVEWRKVGNLSRPVAFGAAASNGRQLVCAGGRNASGLLSATCLLEWNKDIGKTVCHELPNLPQAVCNATAAFNDDTVYLVAGRDRTGPIRKVWALTLPESTPLADVAWNEVVSYPEPARFDAKVIRQNNGDGSSLYLVGGRDANRYVDLVERLDFGYSGAPSEWTRCADLPRASTVTGVLSQGQSHIVVFGIPSGAISNSPRTDATRLMSGECFAYHTITDTWVEVGGLPHKITPKAAVIWGGSLTLFGNEVDSPANAVGVWSGSLVPVARKTVWLDYVAVAIYLAAIAVIGILCSRSNHSTSDFFLGGRQIPWWAAGISLLATQVSSIGIMAIPAKAYATDWTYFAGVATWFVVVPIVTTFYVPFFRRLNVTSAYEYLEVRFSPAVRTFASLSYCLLQLGRLAVVIYLPSLALSSVSGVSVLIPIVAMGTICIAYTVVGGMRAVVWTDVIQSIVLIGGMLLCLLSVIWSVPGGLEQIIEVAQTQSKLQIARPGWGPFQASLWVVLVGNVFVRLSNLTSDQAVVQRYLTTPAARDSKRALWTDVMISIPWALLVFSLGTALFVYYRENPELLNPTIDTDGIVPFFISQQLPVGISGIVIAALVAAALSDMYSSLLTMSTLTVNDFYCRVRPAAAESSQLRVARIATVIIGSFGILSAVTLSQANVPSVWDAFQFILGLIVGSLSGLFLLGVFTIRANSTGALIGAGASSAFLAFITGHTHLHFFLFAAIGSITCVAAGYLGSCFFRGRRETAGLTAYTIEKDASSNWWRSSDVSPLLQSVVQKQLANVDPTRDSPVTRRRRGMS